MFSELGYSSNSQMQISTYLECQGKWAWWTISLPGRDRRAAKPLLYPICSLLVDSFSLMPEYALCFDHLHENSFHILNRLDLVFNSWWKDVGRETWQPDLLSDPTSCAQALLQAAVCKREALLAPGQLSSAVCGRSTCAEATGLQNFGHLS